jgi:dipeptidyl aminopeptidase/acylaminoacyl peptidase
MVNFLYHIPCLLAFGVLLAVSIHSDHACAQAAVSEPQVIRYPSGDKMLGGELYRPSGTGPFPAVLYNHGSAPGMLNSQASKTLGPMFARAGWIFFMPYRRGQGLSADAGPYIGDEVAAARRRGGKSAASATLVRLLTTDHLDDQLAALAWLRSQSFVSGRRIALAGNSFGGIQSILGAARAPVCGTVAASAASESWRDSAELRVAMKDAAARMSAPLFLFQAQNDFDLEPNKTLVQVRRQAGKLVKYKLYPVFGRSTKDGHSFAYLGANVWFSDVLGFLNEAC